MAQTEPGRKLVSAEELLAMPDDGVRRELIAGELMEMTPGGGEHGQLAVELMTVVGGWVRTNRLGRCFAAKTGFRLASDPDTVRAPDGAFICAARVPEPIPAGFMTVVPDLVLEVVSPNDRRRDVLAKVGDWLEAGVQVVWVLWPEERRLTVFRSASDICVVESSDTLTCESLLPGFALPLRELFE